MNEQFKGKVLYISSPEMLEEVRQLLVENGQTRLICDTNFNIVNPETSYLNFNGIGEWDLYYKDPYNHGNITELTLTEFKELLKQNK